MKYEDTYCTVEKDDFSLNSVAYIFANDPVRYARNFAGNMCCAYCRKVPLSFVNAKRPYFRGYANIDHDADCLYVKEEMEKEEVKGLYASPAGENVIARQMDRLLIQFLRSHENAVYLNDVNFSIKNADTAEDATSKKWRHTNKVVPQKQLDAPLLKDDYNVEKIYHGKVHIQWEEMQSSDRMKLLMWGITTKRLICKLFVTPAVYKHLHEKYRRVTACDAYVVFFAALNKKAEDKSWSQGNLMRARFLCINRLNENEA